MITLYTFGPRFGLLDPSPFVTKAIVLLKMAGLDYRTDTTGFRRAPKGKLPYIDDDGALVPDSTFIRWHLASRHGIDLDRGLSPEQKAVGWAVEKMCEDNLYWAIIDQRWIDDANFEKGPKRFFDDAPAPIRPLVIRMVRRQVRRDVKGQGMGRHTRAEIERLAATSIDAIATILGSKPWIVADEPSAADASVWAFVTTLLTDYFQGPLRDATARHANLVAYRDRGMARWSGARGRSAPEQGAADGQSRDDVATLPAPLHADRARPHQGHEPREVEAQAATRAVGGGAASA